MQERKRVYEEVHGVAEPRQKEPEFVAQCVFEFNYHLSTIRTKPAYDLLLN
jgi:hypothetical protein